MRIESLSLMIKVGSKAMAPINRYSLSALSTLNYGKRVWIMKNLMN